MYSYLVNGNSEHKKAKGVNKNKIETYEKHKICLSCFNDKIYIQNNGCDGLALGYQS